MTPKEFGATYEAWNRLQTVRRQERWEQVRWMCYYAVRPYAKRGLRPADVLSFEWDGQASKKRTKEEKEAAAKRFHELMELWKDEDDE